MATTTAGHRATRPTAILRQDWKDIAKTVKDESRDDRVPLLSAGLAFYALLALFPALIATISIYGLFADPADIERQITQYTEALPASAQSLVIEQLRSIAASSGTGLGIAAVVGVLVAVWGASKGIHQLVIAVNAVYDRPQYSSTLKIRAWAVLATLASVVFAIVAFALVALAPSLLSSWGFGAAARWTINVLRWPVLAGLLLVGLGLVYQLAPNRPRLKWRWLTPGAVVGTLLWIVGSVVFSVYASNFGSFNETYGSIGAVIVLLLWMFVSAYTVLIGAEVNAAVEGRRRPDIDLSADESGRQRLATDSSVRGGRSVDAPETTAAAQPERTT